MLSTPHGALGTSLLITYKGNKYALSTPHGALGTGNTFTIITKDKDFQLHTVH